MYANCLTYDDAAFRALLPFFADATAYPQALLSNNFDAATDYISAENYGYLRNQARQNALYYMTGHLTMLWNMVAANNGAAVGMVNNAQVDKVQVQLTPPPFGTSEFKWWLGLTPCGQQLAALLTVKAAGGFFIGGTPERLAFRRVGGGVGGFR